MRNPSIVLAWLTVVLQLACVSTPRDRASAARPAGSGPSTALAVARPRLVLRDGRTAVAGTAFLTRGAGGVLVAVTSAHMITNSVRGSALASFELLNAATRERIASATGLARIPELAENPLDYAGDIALLTVDRAPVAVAVLEVAPSEPAAGALVDLYTCPTDGSSAQRIIPGRIVLANASRIEVEIEPGINGRGFAGAPIVGRADGRVAGITQTIVSRSGKGLVLGTPAGALRSALAQTATAPIRLEAWSMS